MILAFDTSTALTSVALVDGDEVVAERSHHDPRHHAEVLAPMLADVLRTASAGPDGVAAVACGVGPGPYTGLRVGLASAIALGLAWGRPVHGLCSLDAIAAAFIEAGEGVPFGVAGDARRREVYWAAYSGDGQRLQGPLVSRPGDIDPGLRSGAWLGSGARQYADCFGSVRAGERPGWCHPHAAWIARRVGALLAAGVVPGLGPAPLSGHGDDGSPTAAALRGAVLLPPRPLYLRRPDAVAVHQ
ncbi:MAG: tRNA (adenosine(37)-N6)-threonylcarbamoyltransferase complex dimerization subunit type 1 TsaB [Candidatus Nanopelagicales bacterium]